MTRIYIQYLWVVSKLRICSPPPPLPSEVPTFTWKMHKKLKRMKNHFLFFRVVADSIYNERGNMDFHVSPTNNKSFKSGQTYRKPNNEPKRMENQFSDYLVKIRKIQSRIRFSGSKISVHRKPQNQPHFKNKQKLKKN